MKKLLFSVAIALTLGLASCTVVRPIGATSNPVGNKCGTSSSVTVFNFFGGNSNMGINSAAKKAGLTRISHIDYKIFSVLGLYTKSTVLVYGE